MKNTIIYFTALFFIFLSCNRKNDIESVEDTAENKSTEKINVRTNKEIISAVQSILKGNNSLNNKASSTKSGSNSLEIIALATELLDYKMDHIDTLLFSVKDKNSKKNMLISANINCEPILAILDETNESFESTLNIKDLDNPLTPFLLSAIKYNEDPTYFDDHQQAEKTSYSFNKKAAVGGLGRNGKVIASEIHPRVQVQWGQSEDPYTRYTPNNWHAGCVATVIAQAMSVTRHIGEFNRIPLNWDILIKMKNSNYRNQYPEEANTIGLLMREIGRAVNMDYGAQGSGARTKLGVEILEIGKQFYSLNNKALLSLS